jgi:hypothetical protein
MSNIHLLRFLQISTIVSLIGGITLLTSSSALMVNAAVVWPNGQVLMRQGPPVPTLQPAGEGVPLTQVDMELRLVVGMLLVLVGLAFHALWVVRSSRVIPPRKRTIGLAGSFHRLRA